MSIIVGYNCVNVRRKPIGMKYDGNRDAMRSISQMFPL